MPTANQPRPDWSQIDLPPAYQEDLHRLYEMETMFRITKALGGALLGYIRSEDLMPEEVGELYLAWHLIFDKGLYA